MVCVDGMFQWSLFSHNKHPQVTTLRLAPMVPQLRHFQTLSGLVQMNLALCVNLLAVPNGNVRDRISSQDQKNLCDGQLKSDTYNE